MDKFAVVKVTGKQYRVSEGDEILVDKIKNPKEINYDVLLFAQGDSVKIGTPTLSDVKVSFKVLNEVEAGDKIKVFKYKAKSRYQKNIGFRPKYTRLQVLKIS